MIRKCCVVCRYSSFEGNILGKQNEPGRAVRYSDLSQSSGVLFEWGMVPPKQRPFIWLRQAYSRSEKALNQVKRLFAVVFCSPLPKIAFRRGRKLRCNGLCDSRHRF